jgi:predicted  nucleic acid-binding Zn-ribbon protein
VEYSTISSYITSKSSLYNKILAVEAIIAALETRALEVAEGNGAVTDEYQFDDGQIKIRTSYRSMAELHDGIDRWHKQLERYKNQYNGRGFVLRDTRGLH